MADHDEAGEAFEVGQANAWMGLHTRSERARMAAHRLEDAAGVPGRPTHFSGAFRAVAQDLKGQAIAAGMPLTAEQAGPGDYPPSAPLQDRRGRPR